MHGMRWVVGWLRWSMNPLAAIPPVYLETRVLILLIVAVLGPVTRVRVSSGIPGV